MQRFVGILQYNLVANVRAYSDTTILLHLTTASNRPFTYSHSRYFCVEYDNSQFRSPLLSIHVIDILC